MAPASLKFSPRLHDLGGGTVTGFWPEIGVLR